MTTLPPLNIRYPFDPTGVSRDNLVRNETHTLPPVNNRIIAPRLGAFYSNSLVVKYNNKILVKDEDYELAALYHDATVDTGQDVHVLIYFKNLEIDGDIVIDYQVVGGQFTGVWETIQQYVNVLLVDPRRVRWDDILNKPEQYAPLDHFHDINDVYGLNHLVPKLEEIRQAVIRIRSKEMRKVYDRILKIKRDVEDKIQIANDVILRNVLERVNNTDELNTLKSQIRSLTTKVTALERNTAVQQALTELREKDNTLQNKISALEDNRATKQELTAKYNELIEKFNQVKTITDKAFTCESFGNLPVKRWSKGTTLLAKDNNGDCYRMAVDAPMYQDLGVAITVDEPVKIFTQGSSVSFEIKVIATNSGNDSIATATLGIVYPEQNNTTPYTVGQVVVAKQLVDSVSSTNVSTGNLYTLTNIQPGGTVTLTFRLTTSVKGSFQIGAQVTSNGSIDSNTLNNHASITLFSSETHVVKNSVIDVNYNLTANCPMIIPTVVEAPEGSNIPVGTRLKMLPTINKNGSVYLKSYSDYTNPAEYLESFNQLPQGNWKLKIDNGNSYLIVYNNDIFNSSTVGTNAGVIKIDTNRKEVSAAPLDLLNNVNVTQNINTQPLYLSGVEVQWEPESKIISLNTLANVAFVIYFRPSGQSCNWQAMGFAATSKEISKDMMYKGIAVIDYPNFTSKTNYSTINTRTPYVPMLNPVTPNDRYRASDNDSINIVTNDENVFWSRINTNSTDFTYDGYRVRRSWSSRIFKLANIDQYPELHNHITVNKISYHHYRQTTLGPPTAIYPINSNTPLTLPIIQGVYSNTLKTVTYYTDVLFKQNIINSLDCRITVPTDKSANNLGLVFRTAQLEIPPRDGNIRIIPFKNGTWNISNLLSNPLNGGSFVLVVTPYANQGDNYVYLSERQDLYGDVRISFD